MNNYIYEKYKNLKDNSLHPNEALSISKSIEKDLEMLESKKVYELSEIDLFNAKLLKTVLDNLDKKTKEAEVTDVRPRDEDLKVAKSQRGYEIYWSMSKYQNMTNQTAIYPKDKALEYLALGLTGEAGEVANKIKKVIRGDKNSDDPEFKEQLKDEIGDVLWYVAQLCESLDMSMASVAERNINKLMLRKSQNKIKGDGDNR